MQANTQKTAKPMINDTLTYQAVYPEIYYKLKPYMIMACDVLYSYGDMMPTQGQFEQICDGILDEFCKAYPDMADYMRKDDNAKDDPPEDPPYYGGGFRDGFRGGSRPGFGFGRFRRRGLGRDLVGTLLLAELLDR
jgi:hypothetical protein